MSHMKLYMVIMNTKQILPIFKLRWGKVQIDLNIPQNHHDDRQEVVFRLTTLFISGKLIKCK